jgi:hypothetical protein
MSLAPAGCSPELKPPSRLGQYKLEPGSTLPAHRCECCGKSGPDVPTPERGKTVPVQYGLNVLGIMQNNKVTASKGDDPDVRFGDHAAGSAISWITRREGKQRGLTVKWPDGTGPLCYVCADKCRTPAGGNALEWRYVESARAEFCAQHDGTTLPSPWSCVAADGRIVPASDPQAVHGPVALPPPSQVRVGKKNRIKQVKFDKWLWDKTPDKGGRWYPSAGAGCRWHHATAMALGLHPADPGRASGGAGSGASGASGGASPSPEEDTICEPPGPLLESRSRIGSLGRVMGSAESGARW